MKPLTIGIQNLKEIIDGGYIYVDKTQYVYRGDGAAIIDISFPAA